MPAVMPFNYDRQVHLLDRYDEQLDSIDLNGSMGNVLLAVQQSVSIGALSQKRVNTDVAEELRRDKHMQDMAQAGAMRDWTSTAVNVGVAGLYGVSAAAHLGPQVVHGGMSRAFSTAGTLAGRDVTPAVLNGFTANGSFDSSKADAFAGFVDATASPAAKSGEFGSRVVDSRKQARQTEHQAWSRDDESEGGRVRQELTEYQRRISMMDQIVKEIERARHEAAMRA